MTMRFVINNFFSTYIVKLHKINHKKMNRSKY